MVETTLAPARMAPANWLPRSRQFSSVFDLIISVKFLLRCNNESISKFFCFNRFLLISFTVSDDAMAKEMRLCANVEEFGQVLEGKLLSNIMKCYVS